MMPRLTGNCEDPHVAASPNFVLLQQERQQHQHTTIIWTWLMKKNRLQTETMAQRNITQQEL